MKLSGRQKYTYTAYQSSIRIDLFYFERQRDLFDGLDAIEARVDQSNVSIVKAGNLNKKWKY